MWNIFQTFLETDILNMISGADTATEQWPLELQKGTTIQPIVVKNLLLFWQ